MLGCSHDLPPRGNYFAWNAYVQQNLHAGTMFNRSGAPLLIVPDECLVAVVRTLEEEWGEEQATEILRSIATAWGRRAGEQLVQEVTAFYGRSFMDLPLAMVTAVLTEAFRHHGWGTFRLDFSRYVHGIVIVEVDNPLEGSIARPDCGALDHILSGLLSGMWSYLAGRELGCLQTDARGRGASVSRFILTVPERLMGRSAGLPHDEALAELCQCTTAS
jgi:hypothetical protein